MSRPSVSFIVPCYKLARFLPDCIASITSQTYGDFEVLIMDDCSPDDTADVVRSFRDPRIRYIRNEQNLGHLPNYNKGIGLSRGRYVWLISADDYLRRPYVLERYVTLMDAHPEVGYAFCTGYGVQNGAETRLLGQYARRRDRDRIVPGHILLKKLLRGNFVLTPSGMVRRTCYENISLFPLTMPLAGDWYLWSLFALHSDVAYFAEPMVCYREHHAQSMTSILVRQQLDECGREEIAIAWNIVKKARELGHHRLAKACLTAVAHTYARTMAGERYRESGFFMNYVLLEESLRQNAANEDEQRRVRARVHECIGNIAYWRQDRAEAGKHYAAAVREDPWMLPVRVKRMLLSLGKPGEYFRNRILSVR
jgi:glycosyltransferase involved in cell wall biosynthesis